jgi:hypothetical protein
VFAPPDVAVARLQQALDTTADRMRRFTGAHAVSRPFD